MRFGLVTLLLCGGALSLPCQAAFAQEAAGLQPRAENGRQIYEAAQFARYAPQTALDMALKIPGFSITEVSGDRGLGEASQNVLINGQRVTGKSNDAQTALSRIAVSSVIQLEIADGATFNVSGLAGQVLNVVTKTGGLKGNFSWKPQFRKRIPPNWLNAEVNISGKLGKGEFTLGVANKDAFRGGGWGEEVVRDASGNLLFVRNQFGEFDGDRPRIAGTYNLTAANGNILNANAAFELFRFRGLNDYDRVQSGQPDIFEKRRNTEDEWNMELGGDYEFGLAGGRLKLIGFHRFEHSPFTNIFRRDFTNGAPPTGQRFDQAVDEGESVARSEYRWKAGKADWQVSLEGAYNFIDSSSSLFALDSSGVFQSVPLSDPTARVEEKRGQAILSYSRPLSGKWTLQATAGGEYSKLSQSGPNGLTRQFIRPKGSVTLIWKPSSRFSLSSKFQRKVGQLNFYDFLASVDVQNNNNNGSNGQLVPPQSWLLELEANRSLGKAGSIKLQLVGESISDVVEQIPLSLTEEAPGNLPGSAKRLRAEINATLLLDSIGFKGAKLELSGMRQFTSLRDPLTGEKRTLSDRGQYSWNIDFRHDIPGTQWAWGGFAERSQTSPFYRLDYYVRNFVTAPMVGAFVEHKNLLGLKVRGQIFNLVGQTEGYREIFWVNRRNGPVDFTQDGTNRFGLIYRLTVSGTF